jgi:hypothetical protein
MNREPFDVAIDQILEASDGDVRLAMRTVLIQNLELEARLQKLSDLATFAGLRPNDKSFN